MFPMIYNYVKGLLGVSSMRGKDHLLRVGSIVLTVAFLFSGCSGTSDVTEGSSESSSTEDTTVTEITKETDQTKESTTETKQAEQTEQTEPSSGTSEITDEEAESEALKTAADAGLDKEDLRGRYALFLEYTGVIEGNPGLSDHKHYLYRFFPLVADHLKDEKKDLFLGKLAALSISDVDTDQYAGGYESFSNSITIANDTKKYWGADYYSLVIFHETMHFMDAWLDDQVGNVYYMKDGTFKFVSYDEENSIFEEDMVKSYSVPYFSEGGAEKYKTQYFTYASTDPTPAGLEFLTGIEYIFGKDTVDELYFSRDTGYRFVELLSDNGFATEDIVRLLNTIDTDEVMKDGKTFMDPREALIRLYINKIGPDYDKDKKFGRIIGSMSKPIINKIPTSYKKYIKKQTRYSSADQAKLRRMISKKMGRDANLECAPYTIFMDGELKFAVEALTYDKNNKPQYTPVVIDYDFEKDSVLGIDIRKDWVPSELPDMRKIESEDSDEGRAFRKTLTRDNSAAHEQVVTGSDPELAEAYQKAQDLGNRYGIYFWFADLTPDGVLKDKNGKALIPESILKTLDEIEKVLSLYPEDFFEQLMVEYYSKIAICLYSGGNETGNNGSVLIDGKNILVLYVSTVNYGVEGYLGGYSVYKRFPDATALEAKLFCNIWSMMERVITERNRHFKKPCWSKSLWSAMNPKGFKYLNMDYDYEEKLAKLVKNTKMEYFLCNEALLSSSNDRALIYEYMMLRALHGPSEPGIEDGCRAKVLKIAEIIRSEFDTSSWPDKTSWEQALEEI